MESNAASCAQSWYLLSPIPLKVICLGCRQAIYIAAPGEERRLVQVFVPIGADDGDKVIMDGEGAPSEFHGTYHTPSA